MHPFALFPDLFFLSPLATTILRVATAIVFPHLARHYYQKRVELSQENVPIVGRGMWRPLLSAAWCAAVGLFLFFGFYTQLAAIMGIIVALKFLVWRKFSPAFVPLSRMSTMLLLAICVSLLITGAGAFAFDLPL